MADRIDLEMSGDRELIAKLGRMSHKIQAKHMRSAVAAGGRVMVKEAKTQARKFKESGALLKSLGMKQKSYRHRGIYMAIVGARTKALAPPSERQRRKMTRRQQTRFAKAIPAKYIHLVEQGFIHWKSGRRVSGHMFLTKAIDRSHDAAAGRVRAKLAENIKRDAAGK